MPAKLTLDLARVVDFDPAACAIRSSVDADDRIDHPAIGDGDAAVCAVGPGVDTVIFSFDVALVDDVDRAVSQLGLDIDAVPGRIGPYRAAISPLLRTDTLLPTPIVRAYMPSPCEVIAPVLMRVMGL